MRVHNFCAGPCTLPEHVLAETRDELLDFRGSGMSVIEMSHRSPEYDDVHQEALDLFRSVFEVPDDRTILFLQGGATLQFAIVPLNLLREGASAGYVRSGTWGKSALKDATAVGDAYAVWDGEPLGFRRMPAEAELEVRPGTRYVHVTSNETIEGIRMASYPEAGVPLVVDMSSDYVSRPVPWERFDLVYGGAQKNLGPAGLAVVVVRNDVLDETNRSLPSYLRLDAHAAK
ncbi:MAG TPA: 3-phosphoserine/phosphohydroxythreonine transaminase, partial [Actinomycetota bacterium]|nr:3-phosphoserine/phosphohydroxythreonine transaminase [Actinomycetota bacterium]